MMSQSCVTIPSSFDQMPEGFDVTAITTDDQEIMAIQHKELPITVYNTTQKALEVQMGLRWLKIS